MNISSFSWESILMRLPPSAWQWVLADEYLAGTGKYFKQIWSDVKYLVVNPVEHGTTIEMHQPYTSPTNVVCISRDVLKHSFGYQFISFKLKENSNFCLKYFDSKRLNKNGCVDRIEFAKNILCFIKRRKKQVSILRAW